MAAAATMSADPGPVLRDIVLVGGGHSHVEVMRAFAMRPVAGVRLTLICSDVHTPYSGMLPGYVAGHYDYDAVHIDLQRLAIHTGVRLLRGTAVGIDRAQRQVRCADRPPVPYDWLSLNIGATPRVDLTDGGDDQVIPVKPIRGFNARWLALLARTRADAADAGRVLAVVGGGAGGVELLLAMQWRLRRERAARGGNPDRLRCHLFAGRDGLLPTHPPAVRRRFAQLLAARQVTVHAGARVDRVGSGWLQAAGEAAVAADDIVWVTEAGGAAWLADTGLALDGRGFIVVGDTLQSVTDPRVFAAGDIASLRGHALEKAGVFAVRQGPVLAANLRRAVLDRPLARYRPQRTWLALISTGDRDAVASRGRLSVAGRWVWRWKDWIDRRFMTRYADFAGPMPAATADPALPPLAAEETAQRLSLQAMRCGGCGAKVGGDLLARALARLDVIERPDVLVGLASPDDAAIVRVPAGHALVQTIDFFRAMLDDPWLFGQIAANHALGDIFAMGAEAQTATAVATVPPGLDARVADTVLQMMSGAVTVLNAAGCALVGGHTGEGRELALGFAINGLIPESLAGVLRKGGLRPGDALILTKPLGTGTLFAALARGLARGRWIDAALVTMRQSSQAAAILLRQHGAQACTDVTGFGLAGHLLEMTRASGVDAEIALASLPVLDGAPECLQQGVVSSLQATNRRVDAAPADAAAWTDHPRYPLLFDPQTAGGLLAGVPAAAVADCLGALRAAGYVHATGIGQVLPATPGQAPLHLRA